MNKKIISFSIVGLLIIIMCTTYIQQRIERAQMIQTVGAEVTNSIGTKFPPIELQTFQGEEVTLEQFKGKKVIVNFWATWCPPCRTEMPHLEKYYNEYAEQQNVEILALNLTYNDRSIEYVQQFINTYELSFPNVQLENDMLLKHFRILSMPSTLFVDEQGVIMRQIEGALDQEKLIYYVEQMNSTGS